MKKPKIDLSKDGLQRFTLHHIEKVILIFAIGGFLAFLWLGISTEKFADTDPQKLSDKASAADRYIKDTEAWNKVVDKRVARDKAPEIIDKTQALAHKNYVFGLSLGSVIKSRGVRLDPDIGAGIPMMVEYDTFRGPVMIDRGRRTNSPFDNLEPAKKRGSEANEKDDEDFKYGKSPTDLQSLAVAGIQSKAVGFNPTRHVSAASNMVSVRALIEHEKFWAEYDSKLKGAVGYFPQRDRPKYQLLQVQRKIGNGDWQDISLRNLPYATRAPEVVAPENYDDNLCGLIPPIALLDYRKYALHSKLNPRSFTKSPKPNIHEDDSEEKNPVADDGDDEGSDNRNAADDFSFGSDDDPVDSDKDDRQNKSDEQDAGPARAGNDWRVYREELDVDGPAAAYKMVRFFDVNIPNNSSVQYRFRVWVDDPNNQPEGESSSSSGGRDQGDQPGGGLGGPSVGGTGGGFGGGGRGGSGGVYDGPEGGGGGEGRDDPGGGRGGAGGGRGGSGGGFGGGGGRGGGGGQNKPDYKEVPITDSMKDIDVRNRIDREKEDYENDEELQQFFDDVLAERQVDLRYSRATDWVEVTVNVPDLEGAYTVAGNVSGRHVRDSEGQYVMSGEPTAEVLLADWSKRFGTLVSMHKNILRGDFLTGPLPSTTHILNLAQYAVFKLEKYDFRSNRVVLDIMGGELVPVPRLTRDVRFESPIKSYNTPGEVLVWDVESNEFTVHSTSEDREQYLNWRFQEDETSEYNAAKTRKKREEDERNDGGPGFGGDPSGRG